jgi:hypothetical protein
MPVDVVTGFEMVRGKLQRIGATLGAAAVLSACSGAVEEPEVAQLEDVDATTEEDTDPPADVDDGEDTEVDGDEQAADDPDEGTEPADDVAETAEGDPYAIPEDGIDEAYVERVLNAIFEVNREALAITLESEPGGLAPFEAEERLRAIYGGTYGAAAYTSLNNIAADAEGQARFRSPPGSVSIEVVEVLSADEDCVKTLQEFDFSQVIAEAPPVTREYLAIAAKSEDLDPKGLNPTPWVVVDASNASSDGLACP